MTQLGSGDLDALVCSDALARGVDVSGGAVGHVISYDAPRSARAYVHRVGRTARAGRSGVAVTLCEGPKEVAALRRLFRQMGREDDVTEELQMDEEELLPEEAAYEKAKEAARKDMRKQKGAKRRKK